MGSGTSDDIGASVSNSAPLFAVAIQCGLFVVPVSKNPTTNEASGKAGLKLTPVLLMVGRAAWRLDRWGACLFRGRPGTRKSRWRQDQAPARSKDSAVGLAGEALMPRYASSFPLLHAVALNGTLSRGTRAPVMEKLTDDGLRSSLLGTKISIRLSPATELGEILKPKSGGSCSSGVFRCWCMRASCPTECEKRIVIYQRVRVARNRNHSQTYAPERFEQPSGTGFGAMHSHRLLVTSH